MDALGDAPHVGQPPLAEIWAMLQPLHPSCPIAGADVERKQAAEIRSAPERFEPLTFGFRRTRTRQIWL
jgi:hypothetical protein